MHLGEMAKNGKDAIFNRLWDLTGKKDDALFYVKGSVYYNTIKPYMQSHSLKPTYTQYVNCRKEKEIQPQGPYGIENFSLLANDDTEPFIRELSEKINNPADSGRGSDPLVDSTPFDTPFDSMHAFNRSQSHEGKRDLENSSDGIFISYARDGNEDKVYEIVDRLRDANIEIEIDKELPLGADLVHYMRNGIEKCGKCLVFLTPEYKRRSEQAQGGVGCEAAIISQAVYEEQRTKKFIPVLIEGSFETSSPSFLKTRNGVDFVNGNFDEMIIRLVNGLKS